MNTGACLLNRAGVHKPQQNRLLYCGLNIHEDVFGTQMVASGQIKSANFRINLEDDSKTDSMMMMMMTYVL